MSSSTDVIALLRGTGCFENEFRVEGGTHKKYFPCCVEWTKIGFKRMAKIVLTVTGLAAIGSANLANLE
jgi:hypothetical protein